MLNVVRVAIILGIMLILALVTLTPTPAQEPLEEIVRKDGVVVWRVESGAFHCFVALIDQKAPAISCVR